MHLFPKGEFAVGKDKWGEIVRVNMLKIKDWSKVPGVKKAWIMKGFEGNNAYAHEAYRHDADGDGLDEIFVNWQKLTMALKGDGTVLWISNGVRP